MQGAFTAAGLDLVEQTYPTQTLQRRHAHLRGIPLKPFFNASPMVLLGSNHVHLITATKPVSRGANSGPVAIHTALGWALQGAERCGSQETKVEQCLFTTVVPFNDLLPFRNEKLVVRSREDQEAMNLLETKTQRVNIEGVQRYATPLLTRRGAPKLNSTTHSVIAQLRATEKRLKEDPEKADIYSEEQSTEHWPKKPEQATAVTSTELKGTNHIWPPHNSGT